MNFWEFADKHSDGMFFVIVIAVLALASTVRIRIGSRNRGE